LLKKAIGNATVSPNLPTELEPDSCTIWEPLAVLAKRDLIKNGENVTQVLIHWQDKPLEEATWEDAETIAHQFPTLNLEDKVVIQGADIDGNANDEKGTTGRPKIWRVYKRRDKKTSG
jgi:hypothetical protein